MFKLNKEQTEKYQEWKKEHDVICTVSKSNDIGAIGGRFTFQFTPTSLGTITIVKCACGGNIDLTEYGDW